MLSKRLIAIILVSLVFTAQAALAGEVKLAVNAPRGEVDAMATWGELGKYLSKATGETVTVVPLKVADLINQVSAQKIPFVIANPTQGVVLVETQKAAPMATLNRKDGPQFSGVIIASKASGITKLADLKGKKIMALGKSSSGAYTFQVYHLLQAGIAPADYTLITAKKQDDIILGVKSGLADAGFFRTGLIEAMTKEGKVSLNDFTIIDSRKDQGFDFIHSTDIYPEWFAFALPGADQALREKVKTALLKLPADSPAAATAKIKGFVSPLPLDGYVKAMKALKMPPFDK